jgi:hypothetical protein
MPNAPEILDIEIKQHSTKCGSIQTVHFGGNE